MIGRTKVVGDLDTRERWERVRAARDARYRANLKSIVSATRSLALTAAIIIGLIGWPAPIGHVGHLPRTAHAKIGLPNREAHRR